MKTVITLTLLCIMAVAMNAQTLTGLPELKIELVGTPDSHYVVNSHTKTIAAYSLRKVDDKGVVSYDDTRFNPKHLPVGLPIAPGADDKLRTTEVTAPRVHHDGTPVVFKTVSLDVVLFSDGTVAGPDLSNIFDAYKNAGPKMDKESLIKALLDIEGRKGK